MTFNRLLASASLAAIVVTATPALAGDVRGTIADATDTINLGATVVRIPELGRQVVAERDGTFRIADLPAGTYTIEARYIGVPAVRQSVTVPEEGVVLANFTLGDANNDQLLVIGQRANQASALSEKYAADTVSDFLTRDAIGQFPDQNVAESLRRLPGINVLNDQGEGRFVSVRGLDPTLNATTVNGLRLPAPEDDTRAVALDVISADIIESIEVKKSLTPDMDADTIGASIEINTVSAFDRRGNFFSVTGEGSWSEYAEEFNPKASANFAYRLADNVGISGGISFYERFFETDNIEADDWEVDDGLVYAEEVQYRDYDVERQRISGSLGLDFRLGSNTELYVRGLYSRFDDHEFRRRLIFDFGDADVAGSGTSVTFTTPDQADPDEDPFEIAVERDIKNRFERQEIWSIAWGGETRIDGWFFNYEGGYSKSSENENDSVDPTVFVQDFFGEHPDDPGERNPITVMFDYSDERRPMFSTSTAAFTDASAYELDEIELTDLSDTEDEEYSARLDIGREFATNGGLFTVQAGFKGRWREKFFNKEVQFYERDDFTLADALGIGQTYRITDISPLPGYTEASDFFFANRASFELQETDTIFDSAVEDYQIEEDIYAAYGLARWDSDMLTAIAGVRWERTITEINGNEVLLVEEGGTLPNDQTADDDTIFITPVTTKRRANFFAPSLNLRFEPMDDVVFRLAGYRSLVRPNFAQLAPRFVSERNDDDEVEGEFGNPDLRPYKAWNFDASAEWYFAANGAITAGVFYKDVKDYIVNVEFEADGAPLVYRGIAFDEGVIPLNGDEAEIWGVELGFAMTWDMLPAPFDGFLTQANYTYTDATGTVPSDTVEGVIDQIGDVRATVLPTTSEHTFNAVLGYEKGPVSLRLAGTYRDDYLDELGGDPEEDRFVDSHFQLDASAKFRVTPNVQLFAEAINLTDAEYFAYNTVGGRQNNLQYEVYGRTFKGGVKVTF